MMADYSAEKLKQMVEVLDGSRAGQREKAAIRFADMQQLLHIPAKLQSRPVSAAPTPEDFNALQADLQSIHRILFALADNLQMKIL